MAVKIFLIVALCLALTICDLDSEDEEYESLLQRLRRVHNKADEFLYALRLIPKHLWDAGNVTVFLTNVTESIGKQKMKVTTAVPNSTAVLENPVTSVITTVRIIIYVVIFRTYLYLVGKIDILHFSVLQVAPLLLNETSILKTSANNSPVAKTEPEDGVESKFFLTLLP
mgnify:CR=1 FL=1